MFQFLPLITSLTSPLAFLRMLKNRLQNLTGQTPRPWATRPLLPPPHFATPTALEQDIWSANRAALSDDHWHFLRPQIRSHRIKTPLFSDPARRRYILEELDGGESTDYGASHPRRRGRPSRNARRSRTRV